MRNCTHTTSTPSQIPRPRRAGRSLATAAGVAAITLLLSACFEPPKAAGTGSSSGTTAPTGGAMPPPMPTDTASAPKN
jgi:hypothetical protein